MKYLIHKPLVLAVSPVVLAGVVWAGVTVVHKPPVATPPTTPTAAPATAVVEITPGGFVPQTIAVAPNTNVVWVNEDIMPHLPAADPYPTHSSLPSLVAPRALGQKETYSFLFTKAGTIHYHDDLQPTLTGSVEVR